MRALRFAYVAAADLFRRALEELPRDHVVWDQLCWSLGYAVPPRLEEAEAACRKALELHPSHYPSHYHLLRIHVQQGRTALAAADLERLRALAPSNHLTRAGRFWLAIGSGRPRDALSALETGDPDTNLNHAWRAMAHAQAGDAEAGFAELAIALAAGYRDVADLRSSRYWEPLRRDPRWARTLARYGIEP